MFRFSVSRSALLTALVAVGAGPTSVHAATFASGASDYVPGSYAGVYDQPASASGSPAGVTGSYYGFPGIVSPFNPAFDPTDLVGIGTGGSVTLSFAKPVLVTGAPEVGVFTNFGLIDDDYPNGVNSSPAGTFGLFREADVSVRAEGGAWVDLGRVRFDSPINYYANASSPYLESAPANPQVADFGKPFTKDLSSFDGLNWAQTLANLDGSAGGEWIDVPTGTGLTKFSYIRLSIPAEGFDGTDNSLFIDAVSVANSSVPEPTGLALLGVGAGSLLMRRRKAM